MERVYNAFLEIVWSYNRIDPIRSREDNIFLIVWSNSVSKFRTMRSINANVVSVLSSVKTVGLLPLFLRSFIKSEQSVGTVVGCAMRFMHEQRGFLRVTAETVADVAIIKRHGRDTIETVLNRLRRISGFANTINPSIVKILDTRRAILLVYDEVLIQ